MDEFISGFKKISDFYIRDNEGSYINIASGSVDNIEFTAEYECNADRKREENLIELNENLEAISQAVGEAQYLIDVELDGEKDRNLDLKLILKLNRVQDELESCFDMIIEDNL